MGTSSLSISINRYKNVVNKYETTIYVEEAIHRLVEIYYMLGLDIEAKNPITFLSWSNCSPILYVHLVPQYPLEGFLVLVLDGPIYLVNVI